MCIRDSLFFWLAQTWEGFIGAFFLTCVFAFYFSAFLAKFQWFICPVQDLNFRPKPIECSPDALFLPTQFLVVRYIALQFRGY